MQGLARGYCTPLLPHHLVATSGTCSSMSCEPGRPPLARCTCVPLPPCPSLCAGFTSREEAFRRAYVFFARLTHRRGTHLSFCLAPSGPPILLLAAYSPPKAALHPLSPALGTTLLPTSSCAHTQLESKQ